MAYAVSQETRKAFSSINAHGPHVEIDIDSESSDDDNGVREGNLPSPPSTSSVDSDLAVTKHHRLVASPQTPQTPVVLASEPVVCYAPRVIIPQQTHRGFYTTPRMTLVDLPAAGQVQNTSSPRRVMQTTTPTTLGPALPISQPALLEHGWQLSCSTTVVDSRDSSSQNIAQTVVQGITTIDDADAQMDCHEQTFPSSSGRVVSLDTLCHSFACLSLRESSIASVNVTNGLTLALGHIDGPQVMEVETEVITPGAVQVEDHHLGYTSSSPAQTLNTLLDIQPDIDMQLPSVFTDPMESMEVSPNLQQAIVAEGSCSFHTDHLANSTTMIVSPEIEAQSTFSNEGYCLQNVRSSCENVSLPIHMIMTRCLAEGSDLSLLEPESNSRADDSFHACRNLTDTQPFADSNIKVQPVTQAYLSLSEGAISRSSNRVKCQVPTAGAKSKKKVKFFIGNESPRLFRNYSSLSKSKKAKLKLGGISACNMPAAKIPVQPLNSRHGHPDVITVDAGDINPCPCPKANFQHLVPEDEKAEYDAPHNLTSDDLSSADFRELVTAGGQTNLTDSSPLFATPELLRFAYDSGESTDSSGDAESKPDLYNVAPRFDPCESPVGLPQGKDFKKAASVFSVRSSLSPALLSGKALVSTIIETDGFSLTPIGPTNLTASDPTLGNVSSQRAALEEGTMPGFLALTECEIIHSKFPFSGSLSYALSFGFFRSDSFSSLIARLPAAILYVMVMITLAFPSVWL